MNAEFLASLAFDCLVNALQAFLPQELSSQKELRLYSGCNFILVVCESSVVCFIREFPVSGYIFSFLLLLFPSLAR